MEEITNIENEQPLAYELFCDTQQDNLEYLYRGEFDISITDNILALAEESLRLSNEKTTIKKRVYFVMVEGLQNITRHQNLEVEQLPVKPGLFVLQRRKNSYFITTGNIVEKTDISKIKNILDKIKELNNEELNEYYKRCLLEGNFSVKGGAGLGFIEMARKSKGLLSYSFAQVKDEYYYFYLLTEIPFAQEEHKSDLAEGEISLQNIRELHCVLNSEKIMLNYSGIFNQKNLVNLLNIIENQMRDTIIVKMTMFNLVVEMLQNLVKHADHYKIDQITGKYGIFFISEQSDAFVLTSGNYIENTKVEKLKNHLEYVNKLGNIELNKLYNDNLLDFEDTDDKPGAKLGVIVMRLRSQNKLYYSFQRVNENFSFFTLRIKIAAKYLEDGNLYIKATYDKPEVVMNAGERQFLIQGKSIPENAAEFYKPVFEWLENYTKNPNTMTIFKFKFEYINTHSAQQIMKMFYQIKKLKEVSKTAIMWYYLKNDNDMFELGKRLKDLANMNVEFIERSN